MKKLLLLATIITYINANEYLVIEKRLFTKTLGTIKNFSTIHKGYLMATPDGIGSIISLRYNNIIFHEKGKRPSMPGRNKYQIDKYTLLDTIRFILANRPKDVTRVNSKYSLNVKCHNNICHYTRYHLKKHKRYKGYLSFKDDGTLLEMCDKEAKVCFELLEYDIMKLLG